VSFNRINRKTGHRLKQQNVDSETGEVVPREDIARGYEVGKDQYVIVEDQEIDAVQIESTRTIEIDQFVPRSEIDDRFIDSPYYLAPDGQVGQDAFAVIRDTIAKMNMVAIGRVVLTRREHIIALEARGRGLLGLTLRYPYEVRDQKPYFEDIPELNLPKEMLDLAVHIVQTKSGHFDPAQFEDRYENALVDLHKKKEAGACGGRSLAPPRRAPLYAASHGHQRLAASLLLRALIARAALNIVLISSSVNALVSRVRVRLIDDDRKRFAAMFAADFVKYEPKFLYRRNDDLLTALDEFLQVARMVSVTYYCANLLNVSDCTV
jgi:DNA end-binding protein Ku